MKRRLNRQATVCVGVVVALLLMVYPAVLQAAEGADENGIVFPPLLRIPCGPEDLSPAQYADFKAWLEEHGLSIESAEFEDYEDWHSDRMNLIFQKGGVRLSSDTGAGAQSGEGGAEGKPAGSEGGIQRTLTSIERTEKGPIHRYSDGSTQEFRSDVIIETLRDGTRIEKLPEGTTTVTWPNGKSFIRNSDGTGAEVKPDGTIVSTSGKIEIQPGGSVIETLPSGVKVERRQDGATFVQYTDGSTIENRSDGSKFETLKDGTTIERYQAGYTIETRPDGTRIETSSTGTRLEMRPDGTAIKTVPGASSAVESQPEGTMSQPPDFLKPGQRQILLEPSLVQGPPICNEPLLDAVLTTDAATAGVPKPIAEVAQVEEKQPGFFESLIPALIPSIGIGVGGGGERRHPGNPCAGK